jgi:hypothetical protein
VCFQDPLLLAAEDGTALLDTVMQVSRQGSIQPQLPEFSTMSSAKPDYFQTNLNLID